MEKCTIELYFVKTDYQMVDLFTKSLPADRFNYLVCRLGDDENSTDPPSIPPTQQAPHTLSTIKLPILKKEGLHKGYDRFQSLLSQLKIHSACVSTKYANEKFLRSLPSSWSQNVAFVSSDSTSSTNEFSTAYDVSTSSGHNSQKEGSLSYTDELIYSFFANQSTGPWNEVVTPSSGPGNRTCRPLREGKNDTWVWGRRVTWNVGGVSGTIQVVCGARERAVGMRGILAGREVKGQGTSNNMTPKAVQAMIDQAMKRNSTNSDESHSSEGGPTRPVQSVCAYSYYDFMKCQPLNFRGTEGVVGLSRWFKKMELVFHISGCAVENQVKFATCTMLDVALTWWNGHVRTLGHDAAYAITWEILKKKLKDKYCQKFLADETKKVDKYISGLPDNIHGNVMSARPKTLDEAIVIYP
nr:hypothetical protein [Tanacetum cinerariifolium]